MASIVEDKMERAIYLTPFSSRSLDEVTGKPYRIYISCNFRELDIHLNFSACPSWFDWGNHAARITMDSRELVGILLGLLMTMDLFMTQDIKCFFDQKSWACWLSGTPEAIGKAELLDAIAQGMSRWQGFSIGLAKQLAWLDGSLHKRQAAIHQVIILPGFDAAFQYRIYMNAEATLPLLMLMLNYVRTLKWFLQAWITDRKLIYVMREWMCKMIFSHASIQSCSYLNSFG